MRLLCACGEFFEAKWNGDEISVVCDLCSEMYEDGRGHLAPSRIAYSQALVIDLKAIASVYRQAAERGRVVGRSVAHRFRISESHAWRLIERARYRGLIPHGTSSGRSTARVLWLAKKSVGAESGFPDSVGTVLPVSPAPATSGRDRA